MAEIIHSINPCTNRVTSEARGLFIHESARYGTVPCLIEVARAQEICLCTNDCVSGWRK